MTYDVAIIGAGIVGLAHAWRAAVRGMKVVVLERTKVPSGASIRNFGMVWPVGQPFDGRHKMAMRSRELWLELAKSIDIWAQTCGSLHLAHREDEWAVIQEFCSLAKQHADVRPLNAKETTSKTDGANPDGLLGSMWSPTELCVNPRHAIQQLAVYLHTLPNIDMHFETTATAIDGETIRASNGNCWQAQQVIVCGGSDFETLFPQQFRDAGVRKCKLQMLRTVAQPKDWSLGPHLASGLTLRHYESFRPCPSLPTLQQRVASETPELDQFGIHVMAAHHNAGHVVLGDSHEYDEDITPFDREEIESLMLRELKKQFALPTWEIESRWHGVYAKHPTDPLLRLQPAENVTTCISPGGAGMTLSFGWADAFWDT